MITLPSDICEVKLSYQPKDYKAKDRPHVTCSRQAYEVFFKFWDLSQIAYRESFKIMMLNRANKVIGLMTVGEGGQAGTVADPKMILQAALLSHSAGLILCHNHPSGNLQPSEADIKLTRKIKEAAGLLDISLIDHLIINPEGEFYSFAEEGKI